MLGELLAEQVRLAHDGPAWHGASLAENLVGVTAVDAASRSQPEAHSIWEIVAHLTGWTREVSRRLAGGAPGEPEEGDWPAVGEVSDAAWKRALEALRQAHMALAEAAERFPEERWRDMVGEQRDAPLGTGTSHSAMLEGLVQHDAYHNGQIGLLRKALRVATTRTPKGW